MLNHPQIHANHMNNCRGSLLKRLSVVARIKGPALPKAPFEKICLIQGIHDYRISYKILFGRNLYFIDTIPDMKKYPIVINEF